ncbi:efflux RND transporter periplasmic adaptor subunit [Winogradskyella sp. PAMC22761]|nr:efflux RND transporter periplasmic adaptor subunit [Winogradskyella sp. PAMC22761]
MSKFHYLLSFFLILNCNNKNSKDLKEVISSTKIESKGISVRTKVIEQTDFQKQIITNGVVEALQKSEIRFKTSERIASIKVKNGQKVDKGQTLAVLDNAILVNQLNKAKIEVDKTKNKLLEEKINYGIGGASNDAIDPIILKNLKIKSGVYEAQNALESAQLLHNQTIIKAPFSGVVANIKVKTGNFITSADIFCTLINSNGLEVVFSVLENELAFITPKQEITINPFTDTDSSYKGFITEINPLVDENGLIQIKAKINTEGAKLFDGMNVKLTASQPIKDVVVIPKEALVLRSNREVVFSYEDGLAKWNYVKVLDENSTSYALKEGIKIGDTVIVSGNMNLAHDAKVNVNNSTNN